MTRNNPPRRALPPPTPEVEGVVKLVGLPGALALVEAHGGTRLYVPRNLNANSELSEMLGMRALASLIDAYGGNYLKIPVARRWRILILRSRGFSYADIARRVKCSENTVCRTLQDHEVTTTQLDLFDLFDTE